MNLSHNIHFDQLREGVTVYVCPECNGMYQPEPNGAVVSSCSGNWVLTGEANHPPAPTVPVRMVLADEKPKPNAHEVLEALGFKANPEWADGYPESLIDWVQGVIDAPAHPIPEWRDRLLLATYIASGGIATKYVSPQPTLNTLSAEVFAELSAAITREVERHGGAT